MLVLILPHNGADSEVMTKEFLRVIRPTPAICSSNYDNQYDHPAQDTHGLLYEEGIPLYTIKTGDVIVISQGSNTSANRLVNLKADSTDLSSTRDFIAKKRSLLAVNTDTLRSRYTASGLLPSFVGTRTVDIWI